MTTRKPWTTEENTALCALYFHMLDRFTNKAAPPINKAALIREAQGTGHGFERLPFSAELADRSRGSIEAKLMNASAAHRDISQASGGNAETMAEHGYKAWGNYQAALADAMRAELQRRELCGMLPESHPAQIRR